MDNPTLDLNSLEAVEAALEQGQTPYDTHVLLDRLEALREEEAAKKNKRTRKSNG